MIFWLSLILVWVYMTSWYLFSLAKKRNDIADTAWGIGFIVLSLFCLILNPTLKQLITFVLIFIWNILLAIAPSPEKVDELESDEEQREFVLAFREISKLILRLKSFTEFEFNEEKLGIDEQTFEDYKSKYFAIHDNLEKMKSKDKVSVLADIDFSIELLYTDIINVGYIMNLMRHLDLSDVSERDRGIKEIKKQLEKADSKELRLKVDLIREFLDKVIPTLNESDSVDNAYDEFEEKQRNKEIISFASEEGIEKDSVEEKLAEYEFSGNLKRDEMLAIFDGESFKEKKRKANLLEDFIKSTVDKYSNTQ